MSNDKLRADFESWFSDNYRWHIENGKEAYHLNRFEQPPNQYIGKIAHHDWRVWQASRAAPAVQGEPSALSGLADSWDLSADELYEEGRNDRADAFQECAAEVRQYAAPQLAVQGEQIAWATRLYNTAYHAGHHDTVEGDYTHVYPQDMDSYHEDTVQEWLDDNPLPAEQQPFEWPLLDAPALIGGVVVGKGCSSRHVVMIAKRKYQYEVETSPEEHARREKAFKDMLRQIHEGIGQQPVEEIGEVVVTKDKIGNIVSVTRQDAEGRVLSVIAESDGISQSGVLAEGYFHPLPDENDYEFHDAEQFPDGNDCPACVPAVIVRRSAVENQPTPDVPGLVEALEGALSGRPLDTEFWDRCEQFIAAHRKQGGEV